jgi:hypothetical protein
MCSLIIQARFNSNGPLGSAGRDRHAEYSSCLKQRPEFIPIYDDASLAFRAKLAGDHLDWHSDFELIFSEICKLGGHEWAFFQLDECNGIGCLLFMAGGSIIQSGKRVELAAPAEMEMGAGILSAFWADVTWRKDFMVAVWANLTHETIALLADTPMT